MFTKFGRRALVGLSVAALFAMSVTGSALAAAQHGISFTKGCDSPSVVGGQYSCSWSVHNDTDTAQDTLTFNSLIDTVHSAGGDVGSGNIFSQQQWVIGTFVPTFSTPPFCTGGVGTGTAADPFRSTPGNPLTKCTLPYGSRLDSLPFSFYTVKLADYSLGSLSDSSLLGWQDLCDGLAAGLPPGGGNCNSTPQPSGAASSSTITQPTTQTSTAIHDPSHAVVTSVAAGTVVHDSVTVTGVAGQPGPSGNVTVDWFTNGGCTGAPIATSAPTPLTVGTGTSTVDVTGFSFAANAPGPYGFLAHYAGDGTYIGSDGACEPLTVVSQPTFGPALTPGFWKNHQAATTALLPVSLGNYVVDTFAKARAVFDAMKCSSPIDCLAGHELAAKLDLKGGSDPSITQVIAQADALLIAVTYNGVGNFTAPTAAQKALALQLEQTIDNYTNQ
jgi:hypothetical protein